MGKNIAIIGGGISGLCCAYTLFKRGYSVSIFDAEKMGMQCSYGNAGLIVPSHFETLSNPGIFKKGLKWMLNPNSPFFVKPRLDLDFLKWGINFSRFCTKKHVQKHQYFLRDINLYSLSLYKNLMKSEDIYIDLKHNGLLMMCKEEKTLSEEAVLVEEAKKIGLNAEILDANEIKAMEPNSSFNVVGAAYFKDDSQIQPFDFMMSIKKYLEKNGVKFYEDCTIKDSIVANGKIESIIDENYNVYNADEYIFTTGIYTYELAKKFNLNLMMQAGKGFSFTVPKNDALKFKTPMILAEQKVAVTPYDDYVRFGGTMMLSGNNLDVDNRRLNNIRKVSNDYINNLNIKEEQMEDIWAGLRPCSPDGLPYIGRSKTISNLTIATAHAMMGVSLGPATGEIVANLVEHKSNDLDIDCMNLYRF